ncbi:MAG TPA: amidohydrolase family protein [Acidimicrobiales bacterium]|nr:amidohydrolase family protein [Acidimicrobiales bacterium]
MTSAGSAHDLVIRGGVVADGLGGDPFEADVAVSGGTITAVGTVAGRGHEEIDAAGLLVTPGFVDIHTHYDGQATWDSRVTPSSWHGVTTAVMGNCGVGFAPVRPDAHDRLISLMEGVEDIPGAVLDEGIDWTWESFGEYLDAVERRPHDIDLCAQLPHGALRLYVMGERAARLEDATPDDAAAMRQLATEAMRAGAIGFSTSRTLNHRTATGDPTPSLRARADELEAIAGGVADAGHGVIELISDFWPDTDGEFELVRGMVARTGVPLSLSLAQSHRQPDAWRDLLARIEAATAAGLPIRGQVAPRAVGVLVGLQSSYHPFLRFPAFREIAGRPVAEQAAALRDPAFRSRLLAEIPEDDDTGGRRTGRRRIIDYARLFPLGDVPDYEPAPEDSIEHLAAARGVDPAELTLDLLAEDDGHRFLYTPFSNYAEGNLDACGEMLGHPDTVFGLGDGGAHVGLIADASFPTWFLSHWARDRGHGRMPVGDVVRQLTSSTAQAVGLSDRGVLAEGMRADCNVIDFDHVACLAPEMGYDLPAGGKRLLQRARGYRATVVAGEVTYRDGEPTGALPGSLVRAGQANGNGNGTAGNGTRGAGRS